MHASGSYDFRNLARNGKNGGNCGSMAHLSRTIHKDINIPINIWCLMSCSKWWTSCDSLSHHEPTKQPPLPWREPVGEGQVQLPCISKTHWDAENNKEKTSREEHTRGTRTPLKNILKLFICMFYKLIFSK